MRPIDDELITRATGAPAASPEVFTSRQPVVTGFFERRLGADSDGLAVALAIAGRVQAAFEEASGAIPPPLTVGALLRAEAAVLAECHAASMPDDGFAARQPALVGLVTTALLAPARPLAGDEPPIIGLVLAALVYALDEQVTGRPIPSASVPRRASSPGWQLAPRRGSVTPSSRAARGTA